MLLWQFYLNYCKMKTKKTKLSIIKIGGKIIDDEQELNSFLDDFANLKQAKILIHGGGKIANKLNDKLGIKTVMNEGRRITSTENLETVTMVYAGLINKKVIAKLQAKKCNAIGLSGADVNVILAVKRPEKPIDFGWVGDIEKVNATFINFLLQNNITPVFSAICHDGKGQLLNTNADTISAKIAIALNEFYDTELIYCFEKQGVLADVTNQNSVIKNINLEKYEELKRKKVINEGMLPKMENSFHALTNHVSKVIIGNREAIKDGEENYTLLTL